MHPFGEWELVMGWRLGDEGSGPSTAIAIGLALLATLLPVALSLALAKQQARAEQANRAFTYADDVMRRSEDTSDQMRAAFEALQANHANDCTPESLALMRRSDIGSSYLQFVGVLRDNAFVCSSLGLHDPPIPVGQPDYKSTRGNWVRQDVEFQFTPGQRFTIIQNGPFAAVIHKALLVDATVAEPAVALAAVAASQPRMFASRGHIETSWLPSPNELRPGERRTRLVGGRLLAQVRSATLDMVAVAAVGEATYLAAVQRQAAILLPAGLGAGLLLAFFVLRVARAQMSLPAAIRGGLKRHEFSIVLQPIVRLSDRRWVGAEVLVRWTRNDGRPIRPDLFVRVAEESGLIRALTARVLELSEPVLRQIAGRPDGFFLSINLSPEDMHSPALPAQMAALMERTGTPPSQIHLEMTERGFANTDSAQQMVKNLRNMGIGVSIDDFGTGYSSLSELVSFAIDTLKIDKTFVDTIGRDAVTSQVAFHIVEMARSLSLKMIAEGIESEDQAATLVSWGVPMGQGWLFARPLDPIAFLAALPAPSGTDGLPNQGQLDLVEASES
jgi:sensor c-di-GMP phosphodiesterase-like protein